MKLNGAIIPGAGVAGVAGGAAGVTHELAGPEGEAKNMWKMSTLGGVETVTLILRVLIVSSAKTQICL